MSSSSAWRRVDQPCYSFEEGSGQKEQPVLMSSHHREAKGSGAEWVRERASEELRSER